MCRLLPLWTRVLNRVGARPGYVLLTRNPTRGRRLPAGAGRIHPRDLFLLWLRHLLEAELGTQGARGRF